MFQNSFTREFYPDVPMRPSEVEWLGDIPAHWSISQVKRHYSIQLGKMLQNSASNQFDTEVFYLKAQHVQWFWVDTSDPPTMWASPSDIVQFGICSGDLLVCEGGEGGRSGLVNSIAPGHIIQNALHRVRPLVDSKNEFLLYLMSAIASTGWFDAVTNKATIAHFTAEKFGTLVIPIPTIVEQVAIVSYLDYADQILRGGVSQKQELVELMEEYKRAVIQQAVTRGLDPDVPLKPSGVEWLGDIPEHWDVRRLRAVTDMRVSNVDKHANDDEISVRLCNYVDVYKNDLIDSTIDFMPATATEDEISRFHLRIGDVLITKDSETWDDIGVPALVVETSPDLVSGYHLALLRPDATQLLGGYLFRALQSRAVAYQFHVEARGVTRYGLSHSGILSAAIPLPPVEEQAAIVAHLDKLTSDIDAAIAHTRREIELLEEYRTRLIADVVTGKLDVREAAADLPDVNLDDLQPLAEDDEADD